MGNPVPKPKLLAAKLLAIRQHLELSQARMMLKLGTGDIAYHRISEYEHGRRMPSLKTTLRYARAAGIRMEDIVDDDVDLHAFQSIIARAERPR